MQNNIEKVVKLNKKVLYKICLSETRKIGLELLKIDIPSLAGDIYL